MARSRNKVTFYIPGGKREVGETDEKALVREIKEELSVKLVPEALQWAGTFQAQAHDQPKGVEVQMHCYFADYEGQLTAAAEIAEITWCTYANLPKVGPVDKLTFQWLYDQKLLIN